MIKINHYPCENSVSSFTKKQIVFQSSCSLVFSCAFLSQSLFLVSLISFRLGLSIRTTLSSQSSSYSSILVLSFCLSLSLLQSGLVLPCLASQLSCLVLYALSQFSLVESSQVQSRCSLVLSCAVLSCLVQFQSCLILFALSKFSLVLSSLVQSCLVWSSLVASSLVQYSLVLSSSGKSSLVQSSLVQTCLVSQSSLLFSLSVQSYPLVLVLVPILSVPHSYSSRSQYTYHSFVLVFV